MTGLATIAPKIDPLIRRLASDSDGEIVACVRALHRQLNKAGLSFHDVADLLPGSAAQGRSGAPDGPTFDSYATAAAWLARHGGALLTARDRDFVVTMARILTRPGSEPSEKQAAWLRGLVERCGGQFNGE